jgi:hypothetical protein
VICTFKSVGHTGGTALCAGQAFLSAGSVLLEGFVPIDFNGPAKFALPVVGGLPPESASPASLTPFCSPARGGAKPPERGLVAARVE